MKTPKEKAQELVARYDVLQTFIENFNQHHSRECALIAVDEIIKSNPIVPLHFMLESEALDAAIEYWQQVKEEIQKL